MRYSICFIAILSLWACKHEPEEVILDTVSPPVVDTSNCDPNTVYFVNDVLPIFSSSCAVPQCHDNLSAQNGIILDNYSNIVITGDVEPGDPNSSDVFEAITESDPSDLMPPPSSGITLTNTQIQTVLDWISAGALNNECQDSSICDTLNMSYSNNVQPILQTHCLGCHSGPSPQGNLSLTTYNEVKLKVDDGSLLGSIQHQAGFVAMPYLQNQIPACKINQIKSWIDDGAPNN